MNFLSNMWKWVTNQASGYVQGVSSALNRLGTAILSSLTVLKGLLDENTTTLIRLWANVITYIDNYIKGVIQPQINRLRALIARNFAILWAHDLLIYRQATGYAHMQDLALHRVIEQEAVSAYRQQYSQRIATINRLFDYAATRDPAISGIVTDIASGLIDLIGVDDPFARIILGKLMQVAVDRLGVDRVAGSLAQDLAGPLLSQPRPVGLHDVVADIAARLAVVEQQWTQFYADGGSEVEQAGTGWQAITGPVGSLLMAGFFTSAVADPAGWARDLQDTIGATVGDVISNASRTFDP